MSEPAIQPIVEPSERRSAAREEVSFPVSLDRPEAERVIGAAVNLSATGMLVRYDGELPVWSRATATLPDVGQRDVRIVRRDGAGYGCLFQTALSVEELEAVLGSPEALAGFERLRLEMEIAPAPAAKRKGILRLWARS